MGLTPCSITQSHHRTSFLGDTTTSKARWNYLSGSVCRNLQWSIAAVGTTVPQSAVQQMLLVLTLPHLTQRQPNLLCGGQGCCHPQNPRDPAWCYFASLVFCVWMLMGWYNHEPVHPGFASRATRLPAFCRARSPKITCTLPGMGLPVGKGACGGLAANLDSGLNRARQKEVAWQLKNGAASGTWPCLTQARMPSCGQSLLFTSLLFCIFLC